MTIHYLHPYLGFIIIPFVILSMFLWKKKKVVNPWQLVVDKHLLNFLMPESKIKQNNSNFFKICLIFWMSIIMAALGPAYQQNNSVSYKVNQPTILMIDMSQSMFMGQQKSLPIEQIKLALHSWLKKTELAPWALILFTSEAYMASPLSDDGKIISAILPELNQDVMPVDGYNVSTAFAEAKNIIKNSGFASANILLFNHKKLDSNFEKIISQYKDYINNIAVVEFSSEHSKKYNKDFEKIQIFDSADLTSENITRLLASKNNKFILNHETNFVYWHDLGRWLLIPAILCLLFFFRKEF